MKERDIRPILTRIVQVIRRYLPDESHRILLRKEKRHRLVIGVRLIQQAAAVEIDVNDVMPA